jgi:amino acid transporter
MTLVPLIAATYFIVSGGPYGLEELIATAGFDRSLLVLLITPLLWSLPTALMVGELSSALPDSGGFYAWVRRALGPFWGFQEAWLSLVASVFDMAIYPTLFCMYLGRLFPELDTRAVGLLLIAACTAVNLRGARAVGQSSLLIGVLLVAPFAVLSLLGFAHVAPARPAEPLDDGLLAGVLIAMWSYMGWDNASTFARDVHRPRRTYPLAMGAAIVLVTLTYVLPVLGMRSAGLEAKDAWPQAALKLGGHGLEVAILLGGMLSAAATFNALTLSYSRLPMALAGDGYLPVSFKKQTACVLACAVAYSACLTFGFKSLVQLDVLIYGLSLVLEFAALVALRIKEPTLRRPFRIPGGVWTAALLGVPPTVLLAAAFVMSPPSGKLIFGLLLIAAGPLVYRAVRARGLPSVAHQQRGEL